MKSTFKVLIPTLTVVLIGCATKSAVVDNTPLVATSVLTASGIINGYIMPDSHIEQTVYTLSDRRRLDHDIEYDSWASSTFFGAPKTSLIYRLDKNLLWDINLDKKEYVECPIDGCSGSVWDSVKSTDAPEEEEDTFDPSGGESCELTTAEFNFDVVDKQNSRVINGFSAKQYVAKWSLVSKDAAGLSDSHIVEMDFWMTTPTGGMKDAWKVHEEYHNNHHKHLSSSNNPLSRFFSDDVVGVVAMFSGDIENKELNSDNIVVQKLNKLQGYPISIKLNWFMNKNSCPEPKKAEKSLSMSDINLDDPLGSLQGIAGDMFETSAKKAVDNYFKPDPNKPIFNYIYDVKSVKVEQQRMSVFDLPAQSKLIDRH